MVAFATENNTCDVNNYSVTSNITADWGSGYNGEITVTNQSSTEMKNWELTITLSDTIINAWNGILSQNDSNYIISANTYNQVIPAGESVTIGYTANGSCKDLSIVSLNADYEQATEESDNSGSGNVPATIPDTTATPESVSYTKEGYTVDFIVMDGWNQAYNVQCVITNTSSEANGVIFNDKKREAFDCCISMFSFFIPFSSSNSYCSV